MTLVNPVIGYAPALQLPPDIDEEGVAGLHPVHEGFVSARYSLDLLLIEDLLVGTVGGGDPVGYNIRILSGSI